MFIVLRKGCLRTTLPNIFLVWRCYCMFFFLFLCLSPQDICNSKAEILGLLMASLTILMMICTFYSLPSSVQPFHIFYTFFIAALTVVCLNIYVLEEILQAYHLISILTPPARHTCTACSRLLSVLAPRWWNDLPVDVRTAETLSTFKRRLKTHLFRLHLAFPHS